MPTSRSACGTASPSHRTSRTVQATMTGLSPTTQYFYKVRANVDDGSAPNPSTPMSSTPSPWPTAKTSSTTAAWVRRSSADGRSHPTPKTGDRRRLSGGDAEGNQERHVHAGSRRRRHPLRLRSLDQGNGQRHQLLQVQLLIRRGCEKDLHRQPCRTNNGCVLLDHLKLACWNGDGCSRPSTPAPNGTVVADAARFRSATARARRPIRRRRWRRCRICSARRMLWIRARASQRFAGERVTGC